MPVGQNASGTVFPNVPCLFYGPLGGYLPGCRVPDLSLSTDDPLCSW